MRASPPSGTSARRTTRAAKSCGSSPLKSKSRHLCPSFGDVLSDLDSYADWNPFLPLASGNIVEGERIEVFIKPPRAKGTTITPRVVLVEEGRGFSWRSNILFPGLFDVEHYFIIDPIDDTRCRFVQGEEISGFFVIPIIWLIGGATPPRLRKNERGPKGPLRSPPQPSPRIRRNAITT